MPGRFGATDESAWASGVLTRGSMTNRGAVGVKRQDGKSYSPEIKTLRES
ncbi:hypothetical protein ABIC01_008515 [Bradyrhizobium sp. RT4b]